MKKALLSASGKAVFGIPVKAIGCAPGNSQAESLSDSFITVPEPMTLVLLAAGCIALLKDKK